MSDDMMQVIRQELNQLDVELTRELERLSTPLPDCFFHYTTAHGLVGILSSNRLWATDIRYLNDTQELTYALTIVEEALEAHQARHNSEVVQTFLRNAWDTVDPFEGTADLYVTCFCEAEDLLSQWRGYGAGGGGYALGFEAKALFHPTFLDSPGLYWMYKIVYDPGEQQRIIDHIITQLCDTLQEAVARYGAPTVAEQALPFFTFTWQRVIAPFLVCFKSPGFREEQEWRIICAVLRALPPAQVHIRVGAVGLMPYVKLPLGSGRAAEAGAGKLPLQRIIYGPTVHPALTKTALELLCRQTGYSHVTLDGSTIPLRA